MKLRWEQFAHLKLQANMAAHVHKPKASQRTGYTKRRKQIWDALHPEEKSIGATCATTPTVSVRGRVGEGRPEGFAAATATATGQSKATTNRAIARADALGDEALTKVANTSLTFFSFLNFQERH